MKKTLLLVVVAITLIATSCISIIEELTLNKDGSGTYSYTIDMSGLLESGMLDQARAEMSEEDVSEEVLELDTTINAYSMLQESGKLEEFDQPNFWKKVQMVTKMSESEKVGTISFVLDFDKLKEVDYFMKNMSKLLETDETAGMMASMGLTGSTETGSPYSLKKGLFSRVLKRAKQEGGNKELTKDMEEGGDEMMQMMLMGAEYTTIYNLPGKVKKVSNDQAMISEDGKTVTIKGDLLEQMEGKVDLSTSIKFKKK